MKSFNKWTTTQLALLNRLLVVYLLLAVWVVALAGRLVHLQIFNGEEYHLKAQQQQIGFIELSPLRGDILDRHLDELAISIKIDSVFANPRAVQEPLLTAKLLSPLLQEHQQKLYEKLIADRAFVYLARKIPPRQAEQIKELNLAGIYFQQETKRVYPARELAAHVLGFVGLDNEGLSGLEYLYDDQIKGQKAKVHLRFDAKRNSFAGESRTDLSDGNVIVLNIDRPIQYIVEQALQEAVTSSRALNGSAIVMDPSTGEVLAMSSYPSFNPNRPGDFDAPARRNRAILDIYEPGSTFKVVPFSAVLNEDLADVSESIDCRVGTLRIGRKTYREAKRSFGLLNFSEVLAKSSNVGTIKLGLRLGEEKLHAYLKRFGLGEKTGIDLPGEQSGLLRPTAEWSRISIGAISIGQEIGVTAIQMLRTVCAVANGGYLVTPQMVRRILTPDGNVLYEPQPTREPILRDETAAKMKEALHLVVRAGTGRTAQLSGYSSAGKTGTAQKFVAGEYSRSKFIASYAGFAPLQDPVLATIVVINEPRGKYYGGQVAAPAFKQIMERSLIHLRVPQDRPAEVDPTDSRKLDLELASSDGVSIPDEQLPRESLEETVLTLIEGASSRHQSQAKITFKTSAFALPDFLGLSLREVVRECTRLGLRLKILGSGIVVGQRPPAGSKVSKGAVCEVFFSSKGNDAPSEITLGDNREVSWRSP